jgi:hypothetical protein
MLSYLPGTKELYVYPKGFAESLHVLLEIFQWIIKALFDFKGPFATTKFGFISIRFLFSL